MSKTADLHSHFGVATRLQSERHGDHDDDICKGRKALADARNSSHVRSGQLGETLVLEAVMWR